MDAAAYLSSQGIEVTAAAQPAIGRLTLAAEFKLGGERGVLLRPKRGDVSDRYLELLAGEGYTFVIVDVGEYPSFYVRDGESFVPVRALPIVDRQRFPSRDVLDSWAQFVRAAAGGGEASQVGVAQLVARLEDDAAFGPDLVHPTSDLPISRLGGNESVAPEPLRTAAALLAGFRLRPSTPNEVVDLLIAVMSLLPHNGRLSGLAAVLAPLVQRRQLGARRLLVSSGTGAEIAALLGAEGTIVLPSEVGIVKPLLERLLPKFEPVFGDFLKARFERPYDGIVLVPPLALQLSGAQYAEFDLAKRAGKARSRVPAEPLFIEHALASLGDGGLLVAVLPEGLLSNPGHADFREWLLERARLLAVISLPAGSCFSGTGAKCSIVLLRKPAPADDYPILMVDVEAADLSGDIEATRSKLDEFLAREVSPCA